MRNFRELEVWKDALNLVDTVYEITNDFPVDERFGLKTQLNRCMVSIPSNIAEGCSRSSNKEIARFIEIAIGSAFEAETQIEIARRRKYTTNEISENLIQDLQKLQRRLNSFRQYLLKN